MIDLLIATALFFGAGYLLGYADKNNEEEDEDDE